ncbi:MAG: cytochrome c oxidase subunit 3 family protein [Candidatus Hydrogenedentota bacterium]|jgi:cytochrome c oxidase subunit 3|uniref:Cytochrome c oxidase polypeptide III n=1 Tax=Sumerlaea chitinivorans TaxID=2250252 RepID=A0A2Z4Y280_SUMC1|nr:Cytochrome c oxidase polypeptide III [Candidatus Sumerlaea chitinivorans]MCX7963572.1 cytochrome c oxidase subunit 3 family protein [Candidatus Sumerlaea chitinivorans]RMH26798.1 MAG: cytochrome c oxidase subunit 3 family protein [Candidatus Hydrogenedentota bacterium]GIX45302.1 MAG: cytochrome c oxidase subunit III [Candidatus Sumerlaea sp.]
MSQVSSPYLAHHFEDLEQQQESASLGMWLFLVTEVMFFGGLFAAYAVYRTIYPGPFHAGSHLLDVRLGGLNTAVLITSSLTMALAVHAAQTGHRKALLRYLFLTIALGTVFFIVKGFEWHHKYVEHHIPGPSFHYEGPSDPHRVQLFFVLYFCMTGLHALHVLLGIGAMLWLVLLAYRGKFSTEWYTPVELVGLYWHFVDIVWIYLFPLLYLLGRH